MGAAGCPYCWPNPERGPGHFGRLGWSATAGDRRLVAEFAPATLTNRPTVIPVQGQNGNEPNASRVMNVIFVLAAIVIAFLVFTWLLRVVKATLTTALTIALLVLVLQFVFGIGPGQLWQQVNQLWQGVWQSVTGGG